MHRKLFPPHRQCLPWGCYCQLTACKVVSLLLSLSLGVTLTLSLALSIAPSLCANGVRVLENFVARDKRRGAASHRIRYPPYHPDDPECQLPSPALQGAACHSGCGSCVSGTEEPDAKSFATGEVKCYNIVLFVAGQLPDNPEHTTSTLKGRRYT